MAESPPLDRGPDSDMWKTGRVAGEIFILCSKTVLFLMEVFKLGLIYKKIRSEFLGMSFVSINPFPPLNPPIKWVLVTVHQCDIMICMCF